jgi:hypothetical protein
MLLLTASRTIVEENRQGEPYTTVFLDVVPRRLFSTPFVFSNLGIEPTDVRPAPERDRPSEGCQLAVLYCARKIARREREAKGLRG